MSALQVFKFDAAEVRVVTLADGQLGFIGKDVCEAFGDADHKRSLARLDEDERFSASVTDRLGRSQVATAVSEAGLYSLLFAMQPEKARKDGGAHIDPHTIARIEKLKRFKKWVTSEVLPAIRKTGSYSTGFTVPSTLPEALRLAADLAEQKAIVEEKLALAAPKVEFVDSYVTKNGSLLFREVAKLLGANERTLRTFLVDQRVNYKLGGDWVPYAYWLDEDLAAVKTGANPHSSRICKTMVFTPAGVERVSRMWRKSVAEKKAVLA
jgi:anti-repressor protein